MKNNSLNKSVRISFGYYETVCDSCGKPFTRREDSQNFYEKYIDVFTCPYCTYPNRRIKEELVSDKSRVIFQYVSSYSCGYEIEFIIDDKQKDSLYLQRVTKWSTDEWGFDSEVFDAVIPFFEFMYRKYWRVTVTGLEHVPSAGRALWSCSSKTNTAR